MPNIAIASNARNAKKRVRAGPGRCEVEGSVSVRRFWFCYDIMVMVMAGVIVVVVRSLALAFFLIVHSEMTVGFEFREVSYRSKIAGTIVPHIGGTRARHLFQR